MRQNGYLLSTIVCCYEKSDQPITKPGAPDPVSIVCLMGDIRNNQHQMIKSDLPSDKTEGKNNNKKLTESQLWYHCMKLIKE